ncbi:hypothetical protein [uncultured Erythrobacter sp.]|uniref:hypothetical protein n=1 Tax=uncultured Erythrobacter sp. TaxID=263913 RepID=UPI0026232E68|nr:hypothetical protein [uncultured Erythrobacter sp.]
MTGRELFSEKLALAARLFGDPSTSQTAQLDERVRILEAAVSELYAKLGDRSD